MEEFVIFKNIQDWRNAVENVLISKGINALEFWQNCMIDAKIPYKYVKDSKEIDLLDIFTFPTENKIQDREFDIYAVRGISTHKVNNFIFAINARLKLYEIENLFITPACYCKAAYPLNHKDGSEVLRNKSKAFINFLEAACVSLTGIEAVDADSSRLDLFDKIIKPWLKDNPQPTNDNMSLEKPSLKSPKKRHITLKAGDLKVLLYGEVTPKPGEAVTLHYQDGTGGFVIVPF